MEILYRRLFLALLLLLTAGVAATLGGGVFGVSLLTAQEDPAQLSEVMLDRAFHSDVARAELEAALRSGDHDLAASFLALADERKVAVSEELRRRVQDAVLEASSPTGLAKRFAAGLVTGNPGGGAELAGTIAGDLLVFGDVRDILREGTRAVRGEAADEVVLLLAGAGIALTAGTYASLGAATPARAGVSILKLAGKGGRLSSSMVAALRDLVKTRRAREVAELSTSVAAIHGKAGIRAAVDGVRLAQHPSDLAKVAKLAAAKGGKTRAILKLLGRGAIVLAVGAWELASWILGAALMLLTWLLALKRLTERTALRLIRARKMKRQDRNSALAVPAYANIP